MEGESHPQRGELEQVHATGQSDGHPLRLRPAPLPGHKHLPRLQGGHPRRGHGDIQWDLRHSLLAGQGENSLSILLRCKAVFGFHDW